MTDETTQRVMPLLCFQCGMPINNKQANYDDMVRKGMEPKLAFETLGIERVCCRTIMYSAAEDTRLRRRFPNRPGFAKPEYASRLSAQVYTMSSDGSTEPLDCTPPLSAVHQFSAGSDIPTSTMEHEMAGKCGEDDELM